MGSATGSGTWQEDKMARLRFFFSFLNSSHLRCWRRKRIRAQSGTERASEPIPSAHSYSRRRVNASKSRRENPPRGWRQFKKTFAAATGRRCIPNDARYPSWNAPYTTNSGHDYAKLRLQQGERSVVPSIMGLKPFAVNGLQKLRSIHRVQKIYYEGETPIMRSLKI